MKKYLGILAVVALVATPAMADFSAGYASMGRVFGHYTGDGGEFTMFWSKSNPTTSLSLIAYSDKAKNQLAGNYWSFQTFCVETSEFQDSPVDIVVSTTNVDGSLGSHAVLGSTGIGDDLDAKTAYLYTKFATGQLAGYDYTVGDGRKASAGALQQAFWAIEGENYTSPLTGQALIWYNEAQNAVNTGQWSGIGSVRILNLTEPGTGVLRQDMLYLVPAPGAAVLGMLGLGLVGWARRRMAI